MSKIYDFLQLNASTYLRKLSSSGFVTISFTTGKVRQFSQLDDYGTLFCKR